MTPDPLRELARRVRGGHPVKVAVIVTELGTLIDFAGPWQAFVQLDRVSGQRPFQVYTVSTSKKPVRLSGGLIVVPEYTLRTAPSPDFLLVPALGMGEYTAIIDWIRRAHGRGKVIVSVCTGAFQVAGSGILDGLTETTNHEALDMLRQGYPRIRVVGGRRSVKSSPSIYTAGGLTAGIDLPIQLVGHILGASTARALVKRLEYEGRGCASKDGRARPQ
jgi:transcriptional regulator GlxA family with amidase domain